MESQSHNPEFRINPENFHPCQYSMTIYLIEKYEACPPGIL